MNTVPNAFRTGSPSVFKILIGMFRLAHIRQFLSIAISLALFLWIFRLIRINTFLVIIIVCLLSIFVLYIIEEINKETIGTNKNEDPIASASDPFRDVSQSLVSKIIFELYVASDHPGETGLCGICLRNIREGDMVGSLPCMHFFHKQCIEKWIRIRSVCPSCKNPIV